MNEPTTALHTDLRRVLDVLKALPEREISRIAAPLEEMFADLSDIHESLTLCAVAMQTTADLARTLAARPDPAPELRKLFIGWISSCDGELPAECVRMGPLH